MLLLQPTIRLWPYPCVESLNCAFLKCRDRTKWLPLPASRHGGMTGYEIWYNKRHELRDHGREVLTDYLSSLRKLSLSSPVGLDAGEAVESTWEGCTPYLGEDCRLASGFS